MYKAKLVFFITFLFSFPLVITAAPPRIQSCTIDFDSSCPDTQVVCSTKAKGGNGCVIEGLGNCYSSGSFAYEVGANQTAIFKVKKPVKSLNVFFATEGEGQAAKMRFFDINGLQVPEQLLSNGDCSGSVMPDTQFISFSTPVRTIRIHAGDVPVFIDTLEFNPEN